MKVPVHVGARMRHHHHHHPHAQQGHYPRYPQPAVGAVAPQVQLHTPVQLADGRTVLVPLGQAQAPEPSPGRKIFNLLLLGGMIIGGKWVYDRYVSPHGREAAAEPERLQEDRRHAVSERRSAGRRRSRRSRARLVAEFKRFIDSGDAKEARESYEASDTSHASEDDE